MFWLLQIPGIQSPKQTVHCIPHPMSYGQARSCRDTDSAQLHFIDCSIACMVCACTGKGNGVTRACGLCKLLKRPGFSSLYMLCAGIAGTLVYGVVVISSQFIPDIRLVWREVRDQLAH